MKTPGTTPAFLAIDRIAKSCGADLSRLKFQSQIGDAMIGGHRVLLMKPSTFMNRSGIAVKEASDFYKIPPERILVIFDDIALPVGRMRIRRSGSDGGQRGMQNILYLMGVDTLPRIRLGIGAKPHPDYDLKDWVLSRFSDAEWQHLGPHPRHPPRRGDADPRGADRRGDGEIQRVYRVAGRQGDPPGGCRGAYNRAYNPIDSIDACPAQLPAGAFPPTGGHLPHPPSHFHLSGDTI